MNKQEKIAVIAAEIIGSAIEYCKTRPEQCKNIAEFVNYVGNNIECDKLIDEEDLKSVL